jgi:uncharacterized protein YjbJ (UPF0337 family)
MNKDIGEGNWKELKGKIRAKWGKLTDDEIETLKGNLDQLTAKIQKTYGLAKDKAEAEFKAFKNTFKKSGV